MYVSTCLGKHISNPPKSWKSSEVYEITYLCPQMLPFFCKLLSSYGSLYKVWPCTEGFSRIIACNEEGLYVAHDMRLIAEIVVKAPISWPSFTFSFNSDNWTAVTTIKCVAQELGGLCWDQIIKWKAKKKKLLSWPISSSLIAPQSQS